MALLCAVAAQAAESPFFEELPTVLTPSRLPQPLNEAPGSVTVLEGDFIRSTGYRDLARVFRLVPGMQIGQERGHAQWVTYHGLGNNYPAEMQVLIDGRSVYSAGTFGSVDWSSLPVTIDEIERIEIVRGPNAVTYGANAFFGVVNIITRNSAQLHGAQVVTRAGSHAIGDLTVSLDGAGQDVSWRLGAFSKNDDGFDGMRDDRHASGLIVRSDWRVAANQELMLRAGASRNARGEGYASSVFSNNAERTAKSYLSSLQAKWTYSPSAAEEWMVQYSRNQERVRDQWHADFSQYFAGLPTGPLVAVNRDRDSVRDNIEFQNRFEPWRNAQLLWGGELRRELIHADYLYANGLPAGKDMQRFFTNLQWRLAPSVIANVGAAYERFQTEPVHVAPRAFINWQALPQHSFRTGYSRAYAQRTTFEKEGDVMVRGASGSLLAYPYVANPEIRQPRIDSFELGYLGRFKPGNTTFDARFFDDRIKGYYVRVGVNATPIPVYEQVIGSAMYTNLERSIHLRGIEYQVRTHPWAGAQWLLSHSMVQRSYNDLDVDDRTAPYTASLSWLQSWGGGWRTTLTALRMGPLSGSDGFVPLYRYTASAYTSFDARIAWQTRLGEQRFEVALNAINLGKKHQEVADRSQQAVRALNGESGPANTASPMVYLSLALGF